MKYKLILLITFFLGSFKPIFSQNTGKNAETLVIKGKHITSFVDSLKQKIYDDTIKFDRKDLRYITTYGSVFGDSGATINDNESYSPLISVGMKYHYKLDIIENKLVKEFVEEVLVAEKIKSITYMETEKVVPILGASTPKAGWIMIDIKPKVKVNYKVGGLEYHNKRQKRKGGNNWKQKGTDKTMIILRY